MRVLLAWLLLLPRLGLWLRRLHLAQLRGPGGSRRLMRLATGSELLWRCIRIHTLRLSPGPEFLWDFSRADALGLSTGPEFLRRYARSDALRLGALIEAWRLSARTNPLRLSFGMKALRLISLWLTTVLLAAEVASLRGRVGSACWIRAVLPAAAPAG